jgi:hypothetical protein
MELRSVPACTTTTTLAQTTRVHVLACAPFRGSAVVGLCEFDGLSSRRVWRRTSLSKVCSSASASASRTASDAIAAALDDKMCVCAIMDTKSAAACIHARVGAPPNRGVGERWNMAQSMAGIASTAAANSCATTVTIRAGNTSEVAVCCATGAIADHMQVGIRCTCVTVQYFKT